MATYEAQVNKLVGEEHPAADVTEWMAEGLQTIVNVLPEDMLWMLEADTKEYSESTAEHGVSVGTNKILYVQRLSDNNLTDSDGDGNADTKMLVECREVSASLRGRVKAGSGWKEESSETDPVWYKLGKRIYIEPSPTDYRSSGSLFSAVADISTASGSTGFTTSGTYDSSNVTGYLVEVTDTTLGRTRFKWSDDDGASYNTDIPMNSVPINMKNQDHFATDADGWVATSGGEQATLSTYSGYIKVKADNNLSGGATARMKKESLEINGSSNRYLHMRLKADDVSNWYGRFMWTTSGHGLSASHYMHVPIPVVNEWTEYILDMWNPTAGTTDWQDSEITGLRFDFFANSEADGENIYFDWIMFGSEGDAGGVFAVDTISTNAGTAWTDGDYLLATHTATGDGVGATFTVKIDSGVATVVITAAGSGYSINDRFTVANSVLGGNVGGDVLTFDVSDTTTSNQLSNGVSITWTDKNNNHTAGDKYEFSAELSNRSKVYYINNPPSGWTYASTYLGGVVPKEIDPIVLNYVAARALEQKLANIQNGTSASLEQYIIDEDIDLASAQQILIQDTHALIDRYTKEYQMGIQGLMTGTYAPQSTGGEKQQPAYSNVAQ